MDQSKTSNEQQPSIWQSPEQAAQWAKQAQWRERAFAGPTNHMLDAAELKPGDHVLDIAAGAGDQSRYAARRVQPGGKVLATDFSAEMLKEAARLTAQEGFSNITTQVMNAEQLDLPDETFDAAICRLGLMLVANQPKAFREAHRVLKPGRKLAALVWSTADRQPMFTISGTIARKYAPGPDSGLDPYSLGERTVFEQRFTDAGFRDVTTRPVPLQFRFDSIERFMQMPGGAVTAALGKLEPADQQRLRQELDDAVRPFEGPEGLVFPSELLLGVGTS